MNECRWCGLLHQGICPRVRVIEFYEDGCTVRRVEFNAPIALLSAAGPDIKPAQVTGERGGSFSDATTQAASLDSLVLLPRGTAHWPPSVIS